MSKVVIRCQAGRPIPVGKIAMCVPGVPLVLDEDRLPRNFAQLVKDGLVRVAPYREPVSPGPLAAEEPRVEESQPKETEEPPAPAPEVSSESEEAAPAEEPKAEEEQPKRRGRRKKTAPESNGEE